jgi:hypothetical protein
MGNLEKPLTWGFVIVFVGYLFIANCECGERSACALNNGFNISSTDLNGDILKVDAPEKASVRGGNQYAEVDTVIAAWNSDSVDETTISDTTIVAEINIDNEKVEKEEE